MIDRDKLIDDAAKFLFDLDKAREEMFGEKKRKRRRRLSPLLGRMRGRAGLGLRRPRI